MFDNIELFCHSSIKIIGSKIIYIDPFRIKENYNDADYIFCTHSHYDHFSEEDIRKVMKKDTFLVTVKSSEKEAKDIFEKNNQIFVEPDKEYNFNGLEFETTYAYNLDKKFHPKENHWVGFIIKLDGKKYYIAGDTDNIPEIQNINCDVAFIPIGGTYTMNKEEAADLANKIHFQIIIPTHYGEIVGNKTDGIEFAKLVKNKKVEVLI